MKDILRLAEIYPYTLPLQFIGQNLYRIRRKCFHRNSFISYKDPTEYHEEIMHLDGFKDYLFYGNWNFKYYKGIEKNVTRDFVFKESPKGLNAELAEQMRETNSVSIHVRHGDYKKYGMPILSLEYYKEACRILCTKADNPHFFIFSDDIDYVKENFTFLGKGNFTIVSNNRGNNSYIDMQLMSLCKHNINANSTFSYWAARLNQNANKICIIPKYHVNFCKYNPFYIPGSIEVDNHKF